MKSFVTTSQPWMIEPSGRLSQHLGVSESTVGATILDWLEDLGCKAVHGPEFAPHSASTERTD